jgi:hypothetical protein
MINTTPRERLALTFIRNALVEENQMPSDIQLARHMGYSSPNAGLQLYKQMKKKGIVMRNAYGGWKRGENWAMVTGDE